MQTTIKTLAFCSLVSLSATQVHAAEQSLQCVSKTSIDQVKTDLIYRLKLDSSAEGVGTYKLEAGTAHRNEQTPDTAQLLAEGHGSLIAAAKSQVLETAEFKLEITPSAKSKLQLFEGTLNIKGSSNPSFASQADVYCFESDLKSPYTYDSASGTCVDDKGSQGRVVLPAAILRETLEGECTDVEGDLNINLFYPELHNLNLKGAKLSKAKLYFAKIINAQTEGADFTGFKYDYAWVDGSSDSFTKLAPGCTISGERLYCGR